jgi:hypothetical protein
MAQGKCRLPCASVDARMSRVRRNFGGGPIIIRLRSRSYLDRCSDILGNLGFERFAELG